MSQLVPIYESTIGHRTIQTANAREIHSYLEVKTLFTDWMKRRIATYQFSQDIDFTVLIFGEGSTKTTEYYVTMDMAKQLAMVERTMKGREAREYFIECERVALTAFRHSPLHPIQRTDTDNLLPIEIAHRQLLTWLELSKVFEAPLHIAQIEAVKAIEASTGVNLKPLLAHAPAQRNIPDADVMLEPTSLGKALGYKNGHEMNLALETLGWQVRDDGGEWVPTALGKPYAIRNSWVSRHSTKAGYNFRWSRAAVAEALEREKMAHER